MKKIKRSILPIMLILTLIVSLLVPSYTSEAAEVLTYSTESNSGTRDVVCTTLDGTSASSYYQNYSYDDLSTLSSSALFTQLQTLMRSTHSYTSSYDDCHYKANLTDCEENNTGYLSLIYTSYDATQSQWNGWNREHVWPKSLGGNSTTGGGSDLHHIRPSDAGVNSSRGNKPYGESGSSPTEKYGTDPAVDVLGGTYNSTYFEPLDNVKGDVARICLYVYVRWNSDWGATDVTAVFESVDILLEWCELDPVDTWEMGRNEVVGAIQGNRNVFIDYPEYAWLLFDKEVPTDMVTPSSEASGGTLSGGSSGDPACEHTNQTTTTTEATCTVAGLTKVTCDDCGATVSSTTTDALGHNYVNDACTLCGKTRASGTRSYIATVRSSGNYFYMTNDLGSSSTSRYQAVDSGLTSLPASIESPESSHVFVTVDNGDGTYSIYAEGIEGDNYLGWTSGNSGTFVSEENALKLTRDENSDGTYSFHFTASDAERYLALNGTSGNDYFAFYKSGQKQNLVLIPIAEQSDCEHANQTTTITDATCTVAGSIKVTCDDCGATVSNTPISATGHQNTTESTTAATCTVAGSTTVTCDDCGATVSSTTIAALGHSYTDGVCTVCGNEQATASAATRYYIAAIRSSGNYFYMTNDLGTSSTNRYQAVDSGLTALPESIENPESSHIFVIVDNGDGTYSIYAEGVEGNNYLGWTSGNSGTLVAEADALKLTRDDNGDGTYSFHFTASDAERYLALNESSSYNFFAFYKSGQKQNLVLVPLGCQVHSYAEEVTVYATCTEGGSRTETCTECGYVNVLEEYAALGHNSVDGVCVKCGYLEDSSSDSAGGAIAEAGWYLVTDASELKAGDKIVIVSDSYVAGNITGQYLAQVSGVSATDGVITTLPDGALILTLGGSEGAWTLADSGGQLLGATAVKKLAWDSGTTTWTISISDSSATIQNGTSTYGRFLYNATSPRFTTYTSSTSTSMLMPQIYKYVEASSDSEGVKIATASMTIGSTLAINYYVTGCDASTSYYMVFTMNGVQSEHVTGVEDNGRLMFSFTGIPPQFMGDSISASLYASGNETPVATVDSFSVKAYAEKVIALFSTDAELMNLIVDMLRYGAAAQTYRNYKTDALVTENLATNGIDISTYGSAAKPTDEDNARTLTPVGNISELTDSFTAAGVRFDFDNKVYIKFKTDDLAKIKITINGNEIANIADTATSSGNGTYILYTDGISATQFDEIFRFEMYVNDTLHQTLTYSVNSYAYAKCGDLSVSDESTLDALAQLVRALYRYGLSAKAYKYQ